MFNCGCSYFAFSICSLRSIYSIVFESIPVYNLRWLLSLVKCLRVLVTISDLARTKVSFFIHVEEFLWPFNINLLWFLRIYLSPFYLNILPLKNSTFLMEIFLSCSLINFSSLFFHVSTSLCTYNKYIYQISLVYS